jgi:hypothetical protein
MPAYVPFIFVLTTLATIELFARASRSPMRVRLVLFAWIVLQGAIAATGFYGDEMSVPPRFGLAIGPPVVAIVLLFTTAAGRRFVDSLDLRTLTWMHTVRVPVELTLFWLFQAGLVPELMTFEGVNFDIFSGLTAPIAALVFFRSGRPRRTALVIWNAICLLLVINILTRGILSVETPFQQFGFDQPNTGVLLFPYVWLPALIVPIVVLAHVVAFRQLRDGRA